MRIPLPVDRPAKIRLPRRPSLLVRGSVVAPGAPVPPGAPADRVAPVFGSTFSVAVTWFSMVSSRYASGPHRVFRCGPDASAGGRDALDRSLDLLAQVPGDRGSPRYVRLGGALLPLLGGHVAEVALHQLSVLSGLIGLAGDGVGDQHDRVGTRFLSVPGQVDGQDSVAGVLGRRGDVHHGGRGLRGERHELLSHADGDRRTEEHTYELP